MPSRVEVIGHAFGRLLVVSDVAPVNGRRRVLCRCACGAETIVEPRALRNGRIRSCGCAQREAVAASCAARTTHGQTGSPEYVAWSHMKARCERRSDPKYADYGARGIKVCSRWREDFAAFLADMGPKPSRDMSVDRIDVDGDYEPANCRWATQKEQARNKRRHRIVQFCGEAMPLSQACEAAGINYRAALYRLNAGKPWRPLPHPPREG